MHIVLLGSPGAGKGSLSKQLKDYYGYISLTPGELYRKEAELQTEFGLKAKSYWGSGGLCPDEMTNELIRSTLKKINSSCVVFDGYPRTVAQAKYLDSIVKIDVILHLLTIDEVVINRLMRRKEIENRIDDTPEGIKKRIYLYHLNIQPIVDYYLRRSDFDRYISINGNGGIDESFEIAKSKISF